MIQNVYFDDITSSSLGLVFLGAVIGTPEAKTSEVDIPYSDGKLDLTDYYGVVRYKNRSITLEFVIDPEEDKETVIENVLALTGTKKQIIIPNNQDEYFIGRLKVSNTDVTNSKKQTINIDVDAEPYRYTDVSVSKTFTAAGYIDCSSAQQIVSPVITNNASAQFRLGTTSVTYSAGSRTVNAFKFVKGNNRVYVTPSGGSVTVTIAYRKGRI